MLALAGHCLAALLLSLKPALAGGQLIGQRYSPPLGISRKSARVTEVRRALLREASLPGPYVLVGHSLGGLYARRFATRFPDDVAGLVLVDSADEKQLTGIIAPGLKPELYRPGTMSDSEIHEFFKDLRRRMMADRSATAAGSPNESSDDDAGEIRTARFCCARPRPSAPYSATNSYRRGLGCAAARCSFNTSDSSSSSASSAFSKCGALSFSIGT